MNKIKDYMGTILGAAIMAFGISSFLLPNQLSSGGFSGIATITYYQYSNGNNDICIKYSIIFICRI